MMRWPHYPFQFIVAFGSAMYAVVLFIQMLSDAAQDQRRGGSAAMSRSDAIGLIGIGVLLLLMALRMPIGIAMLLVGIVGFADPQRRAGRARGARQLSLSICRGLRLRRHSAVRADGQSRLGVGHGARSLCRRLFLDRPRARRARARHHPRLRRLCRGVGIERGLGGDHGQGLPAGDAALQLQPPALHRRDRRRRHARHPDPAEHRVRDLRAAHRAVDRQAAARRHSARPAADRDLHGHGRDLDALQAAIRPARPARELAASAGTA